MPESQIDVTAPTPGAEDAGPVGSALDVDGLLDQYFPQEDAPAPRVPKADAGTPADEEDTPDGHPDPESEDEDTPEEEAEDAETVEDEEEEDDEEPLSEEGEDDELDALLAATDEDEAEADPKDTSKDDTFLPEFDRAKFLKKHPELEKPYKHMQAAWTKAMQQVRRVQEQARQEQQVAETAQKQMADFQTMLKDDASFEEFLVRVSLNRPEVVERAYERAATLNEDEGKKKDFLREQDIAEREKKLKEREERDQLQARQQRTVEIIGLTKRVATKLGLTGQGDLEVAEQYVANQILSNVANGGERDITTEQLVAAVRKAHKALAREKESVRKATKTETRKESLKAAQDRARQGRRPAPPRRSAPVTPPQTEKPLSGNRPKRDGIDAFIDEQLGVEA